jgi:hypothetical protein
MTLSRRKALTLIGGGTILAATAATGAFLGTRTPKTALAPWALAGSYDDPRLNALSFGLLAPNPHNLQPWEIALEGADGFVLYHDRARRLPHTDPYDRQLRIGFGCFLEQTVLAAGAMGYGVDLTLFPEGPDGPVARGVLRTADRSDPLAAQIMHRRSCKEPFADRSIAPDVLAAVSAYADVYALPAEVSEIKALTWDAWMTETMTPHTMQESVDLMRFGRNEIEATPDGIDLQGGFLESLMLVGAFTRESAADPDSMSFQQGIEIYREMLFATPAYVALTSAGNAPADHIEAGRRWLRLNLATTGLGLSLHPVSQALQEYPEMAPHYARAHELLAPAGHTVQMLGRLGYGPETARTPRWPLEAKRRDI